MVRKPTEKRASSGSMYCLSVIYITRQRWNATMQTIKCKEKSRGERGEMTPPPPLAPSQKTTIMTDGKAIWPRRGF